jgi:uncharacterized protein (DUF2384 family)
MNEAAAAHQLACRLSELMASEVSHFDAKAWVNTWLDLPLHSLNGKCPRHYPGSENGVLLIADLLMKLHKSTFKG